MTTRAQRPLWRLLALLLTLSLVAAACGDDDDDGVTTDTAPEQDTDGDTEGQVGASVDGVLKFGAVLPQTGDLADFGPGMSAGVQMAVDDINEAGGVLGNDVELVEADSGTETDIANTATERMIARENVDAILGAAASGVSLLGVIEPTIGAGRLQCSGSNTTPAFTTYDDNGLYFRTAPSDAFQSQLLADTIAADGHSSVAILNRSDEYGQAFADITAEELEAAGADVAAQVAYDQRASNFDAEAEEIANAQPDAVVVIAFPEEGANVLTSLIEAGVGPQEVPHYYTDGLASDELAESVDPGDPTSLDGTKGTRPGAEDEPTEFNNRLSEEHGVTTSTFAANFYDCAVMIALAAESTGTDDPQRIAEALVDITREGEKCNSFQECKDLLDDGEDIDYDGITGFDLNDTGEPAEGTYELWEFQNGGELVTLESQTIRSEEE